MPALANEKHERYAKQRANNFIPKKAAVAAGYASGSAIYTELEANTEIQARIEELIDERHARKEALRAQAQEAGRMAGEITGVTHGWVINQLKAIAESALDAGEYKEAKESIVKIGEHLGMFGKGGGNTGQGGALLTDESQPVIDLDMVDALTKATDHLQPVSPGADLNDVDPILIDALIEGQGTHGRRRKPPKPLTTGSETDVAMRIDDDPADAG